MSGTTTLEVTLSGSLQTELSQPGVWADAVWYSASNTTGTWTNLVANGAIVNAGSVNVGTVGISLPNTVADPTVGGKVYFIIQSGSSSTSDPIQNEITSQSAINPGNAATNDFGYDSFEVSLEGASGDAGNLSSVNAFALPMEVSVPYSNGATASVGYGISGNQIVNDIGSIIQTANGTTYYGTAAVSDFTSGPLASANVFRTALSPAGAAGAAPFPSSVWLDYINNIESIVPNITSHALSPIVLSGEFNGAASVDNSIPNGGTATSVSVWHNGGYFAYQLEFDSTNSAFALVPLSTSQIQGTIEISETALAANIYSPGLANYPATIYSNGTIYQPDIPIYSNNGTYSPDAPMNTGANNQWGKVLSDFFTGFTGGFYEQSGTSPNPQVTGTIDLNHNMNWEPIYAFGNDVIQQSATYQTSDPYSKIFYDNSNSYGSAYSDNLMSQYSAGGPLISMNNPGSASDVGTIDLTIFANSDTPTGYTTPKIYNYISAASTGYAIPNDATTGDNIDLVFAASVANNAGVVLAPTATITLYVLNSESVVSPGTIVPSWDTITLDGATAGSLGLWQLWNITGTLGSYTATPSPNSEPAGSMLINNLPVYSTGTAVSWYQIGVGGKTFNLYTTTIGGGFENPNYVSSGTLTQQGSLAVDGLATIAPPITTAQTIVTFTVNFATSSAITVNPSLFVANTAAVTPSAWATLPFAPVAGTISSGGTFNALQGQIIQTQTIHGQTIQTADTITTTNPNMAFAWTGKNIDPSTTSAIGGYTNKIDAGDVALVTITSSGTTYTTDGTADIDGMWNTGTVDLGPGTYTVTMQEFRTVTTQGSLLVGTNALTPQSSALVLDVTCFAAGTRIATERGEVAVEALREGDRLQLVVGSTREVVWIGQRTVDCTRHPEPYKVWPVRVRAGTFGPGQPARDLHLSPDHAVYVMDVLIPVKYLIDGNSVVQVPVNEVAYYHIELPEHSVLLAEGLPVESYLDTGDRANFANGEGPMRLFPDFSTPSHDIASVWEAKGCAPLVVTGPELARARAMLLARAQRPAQQDETLAANPQGAPQAA